MNNELHVVLGASGVIGKAVIEELKARNLNVRAVGRNKEVTDVTMLYADLLDLNQTINAVKDAAYVYLCVGITYNAKVWEEQWPKIMNNVIEGCEKAKAKLIFIDNVYMYGPAPLDVPFTELHRQEPSSQKGKVRKQIAAMLLEAHISGRIKAVIGRSGDFYGPGVTGSMLYPSFLERILQGKSPQSLSPANVKHTYAYSKDNGRALIALALDESTYGQVWHLPVSRPITGEEAVSIFNRILETNFRITLIPRAIIGMLGLMVPIIHELKEMQYQFNYPYVMNFDKFMNHFPDFKVMEIEDGLREMVNSFQSK